MQGLKRIQIIIVLMFIVACTAEPTPEPADAPPQTPIIITATQAPTQIPTQTHTPVPVATATTFPTAIIPPACTHDLTFIADMSIPDGSPITVGATITKTWRIRNDGTCSWNSNYTFRQIGGDALTASTIASPVVGRGQIIDISVTLTVGSNLALYDDLERATFRMFTPSGVAFGDSPYVEVAIQGEVIDDTCTNAISVLSTPSIGIINRGGTYSASWTIRNDGTCTWNNYRIQQLGSGAPLIANNVPLILPVIAPGQSHTFTLIGDMADDNASSGLYSKVFVIEDANGSNADIFTSFLMQIEYINGTGCVWDSDFISDVTIPDGTIVNRGQVFTKTWKLENSGTCPWDNFTLHMIEDENSAYSIAGEQDYVSIGHVVPGAIVEVSVSLVLNNTVSPGDAVRARFQIQGVNEIFFGTMPYVEVEVGTG